MTAFAVRAITEHRCVRTGGLGYREGMVLFPLAVIWLIVIFVWVLRNSRNAPPEERVWRRWRPSPRRPRDGGDRAGTRARAKRESARSR
jgi:hypothetical protein